MLQYKAFLAQRPPLLTLACVNAAAVSALCGLLVALWKASLTWPLSSTVRGPLLHLLGNGHLATSATVLLALLVRIPPIPTVLSSPPLLYYSGFSVLARVTATQGMGATAGLGAWALNARYWHVLVQYSLPTAPQLYLYSKGDLLVPYTAVEEVARRAAAAGRNVST